MPDFGYSPAVRLARMKCKSLTPGTISRTTFSAHDVAAFVGLEGVSFVAQLHVDSNGPCRVHIGQQWHVEGHPIEDINYEPAYVPECNMCYRSWLIDIAAVHRWVSHNEPSLVVSCRATALEDGWCFHIGVPINPPSVLNQRVGEWSFVGACMDGDKVACGTAKALAVVHSVVHVGRR